MYTIHTGSARLSLDPAGRLTELTGDGHDWLGQPVPLWEITVQAPSTTSVLGRHRRLVSVAPPCIRADGAELHLRYERLTVEDVPVDIALDLVIRAADGEFTVVFRVENHSADWTVREVRGPIVAAAMATPNRPALLWPRGAGQRLADPTRVGVLQGPYPTRLFMPWMALDAGDCGLYVGCHDDSLQTLTLNADATGAVDAVALSVGHLPFCAPGESVTCAPVVLRPYRGPWHEAAARYRRWADAWFKPVEPPAWLRDASGWQLVILKQQNGELHWPYADLPRLCELGRENGLSILGLFGWTEGGHDRRYPIYEADEAMGGETALREGIRQAHAAGQRVILYTNGQLRDLETDWHAGHGAQTAAVSERGELFGESWQKYQDAPPRRMSYGCQSSPAWSDTLLALARKVEALGADGIIFDQLGSAHPTCCFSREHGHTRPSRAIGPGVAATLARVQRELHAVNPDFIVLTEHVTDGINRFVDLTHGCDIGFTPGPGSFPELLRFTFPEILATQRHPTPVMDRATANWSCLYGFAHEVEYRYWPDRLYIDRGIVPAVADYVRIGSPPNIGMMRALDPRAASAYLRQVIGFERRHADLFRDGRFCDTLGFVNGNPAVVAKSYRRAGHLGVLLWNPTEQPQAVQVTVAGARFAGADAPEAGDADPLAPLPPQSLRLLRYVEAGR